MKLITRDADSAALNELRQRLEEKGIPAFVGGENVARIMPPLGLTQAGLWIYLDRQYEDAIRLVDDPDSPVVSAVDVEAFYASQPGEAARFRLLNRALIHIALIIVAVSVGLYFLAWVLTRL